MWGNLKNLQILLSKLGVTDAKPLCSQELTLCIEVPHSWIHPTVNCVVLYYVFIGGGGGGECVSGPKVKPMLFKSKQY